MFKEERERSRLNIHFGGNHEYRFESNTLFTDIVLRVRSGFCANRDLGNGFNVLGTKSVFIVFDNNLVREDAELYIRL